MPGVVVSRLFQLLMIVVALLVSTLQAQESSGYKILKSLKHNSGYFTQGLEVHDGLMFESSGGYGKSKLRKYPPGADNTLLEIPLQEKYFAEGLSVFSDELFVLTWRENTLFVLDPDNLQIKRELTYEGQGWGLASNSTQLIMSDGSDTIYFRDPQSFAIEKELHVRYQQHSVRRINELEFAQGYLWANIWRSPFIIKIKPTTGAVVAFYDFTELVMENSAGNKESVLNGIAYDAELGAYWITGKLWPRRYLVSFD